ncbi:hypothetical protein CYMTET_50898, partial [Cymbomonas tetramitiformis]
YESAVSLEAVEEEGCEEGYIDEEYCEPTEKTDAEVTQAAAGEISDHYPVEICLSCIVMQNGTSAPTTFTPTLGPAHIIPSPSVSSVAPTTPPSVSSVAPTTPPSVSSVAPTTPPSVSSGSNTSPPSSTFMPTQQTSSIPTTAAPSTQPTVQPSTQPTVQPSTQPTVIPSSSSLPPTSPDGITGAPIVAPTMAPTSFMPPTASPYASAAPTPSPTSSSAGSEEDEGQIILFYSVGFLSGVSLMCCCGGCLYCKIRAAAVEGDKVSRSATPVDPGGDGGDMEECLEQMKQVEPGKSDSNQHRLSMSNFWRRESWLTGIDASHGGIREGKRQSKIQMKRKSTIDQLIQDTNAEAESPPRRRSSAFFMINPLAKQQGYNSSHETEISM